MDRRYDGKSNQKKTVSVFASDVISLTAGAVNDDLFTLPTTSLVTKAYAVVTKAGGTDATVKLQINGTDVTELEIDTVGVSSEEVNKHYATGGRVKLNGTIVGTPTIRIVVEYVELDLTSGTYTD